MYRISGNSDSACGRVHGDIRDWDNSDSAAKFHEAFIVVAILVIVDCSGRSEKSSYQNDHNRYQQSCFHDYTSVCILLLSLG